MRLRRRGMGAAGVLLLLTACGGDGGGDSRARGYSPELRAEFVVACVAQGTGQDQCGCLYDELEDQVPFERFEEIEEAIRSGETEIPDDVAGLAAACAAAPEG